MIVDDFPSIGDGNIFRSSHFDDKILFGDYRKFFGSSKMRSLAVDADGFHVSAPLWARVFIIMSVTATVKTSWWAFTDFCDVSNPVARKTYTRFRYEGTYLVPGFEEEHLSWKNLSCELDAKHLRGHVFAFTINGYPSI